MTIQFADNFKAKDLSAAALFLSIQPQRALSRPYALCRHHAVQHFLGRNTPCQRKHPAAPCHTLNRKHNILYSEYSLYFNPDLLL